MSYDEDHSESAPRCWQDKGDWIEETYGHLSEMHVASIAEESQLGCGFTCLLPEGHEGEHEWTPDDEILTNFKDVDGAN